jgi:hypothetical protein
MFEIFRSNHYTLKNKNMQKNQSIVSLLKNRLFETFHEMSNFSI